MIETNINARTIKTRDRKSEPLDRLHVTPSDGTRRWPDTCRFPLLIGSAAAEEEPMVAPALAPASASIFLAGDASRALLASETLLLSRDALIRPMDIDLRGVVGGFLAGLMSMPPLATGFSCAG